MKFRVQYISAGCNYFFSCYNIINRTNNTEQFKKKVTLSHVYNEVTSEPTITRYPAGYRTPSAVESPF
jgi:hypothetical protein